MGLAIADANAKMAQPLSTMERINRNEDMRRLREVIREHGVRQIVVGLPLKLDGTRGEMAEEAERFAQRVQKQVGVAVEMVDERLTSWEAERQLEEQFGRRMKTAEHPGKRARRRKTAETLSVDSMAAAIILRDYLQRQAAASGTAETREAH